MSAALLILFLAIGLCLAMGLAWWVVLRTKNSGWADVIWSYSIGGAGVLAALEPLGLGDNGNRQLLAATIVGAWSLRLGTHILRRTAGSTDDPRYAQLRTEWGADYPRRLFLFLQIQAVAALLLVVVVLVAAHNPAPLGFADALAAALALAAITGEGIADAQLARFKKKPANKHRVCDVGLWSLSRHPNYFFEWLHWLAYPLLAIGYGWGLVTLLGPVLMYYLLVHASGIPPLEAHMLRSRPEAFRRYQRRVRAFWPIPKRPAEAAS